jgi:hypothetical protein
MVHRPPEFPVPVSKALFNSCTTAVAVDQNSRQLFIDKVVGVPMMKLWRQAGSPVDELDFRTCRFSQLGSRNGFPRTSTPIGRLLFKYMELDIFRTD